MANISTHANNKAGILTQVTFAQGTGGDELGKVMAKTGEDGAQYHDWINHDGTAVAVFTGNLNRGQQEVVDLIGASTSLTTLTDWDYKRREATGQMAQTIPNARPGSDYVPQYE